MTRWLVLAGVLSVFLVVGSGLQGQDKKEPPKVKGTLPQNWGKLGLTDKQKAEVYRVRAEYGEKIDALKKQIKDLEDKERVDLLKVLSEEQRTRLREILAGKAGVETPPKKDDKPKDK